MRIYVCMYIGIYLYMYSEVCNICGQITVQFVLCDVQQSINNRNSDLCLIVYIFGL